ncbi:hypothetical protein [Lentilactobacillus sp. Marseille-Q4993]|uniref:DUF6997 domain-containing protein n=1 Tax=Lentilactobacillus sp. Marseille-Q4993 TaxID=3039492 RepID=UPI0024BCFBAD|nr:hypothetical protein [Lentilactobacillus sp. Marseille-Q4993]
MDSRNENVVSTLSGKNNVDGAEFVLNTKQNETTVKKMPITLKTWQSEIDGVYESEGSVMVIESKMKLPEDFNIRQLFIPNMLVHKIMDNTGIYKDIYTCYFVKTADDYQFNVYQFTDQGDLNSLQFIKEYRFTVGDNTSETLTRDEMISMIESVPVKPYPKYSDGNFVSYPQANNVQMVVDYLVMLSTGETYKTDSDEKVNVGSKEAFMDAFKYDARQFGYYSDMLGYLGLADRKKHNYVLETVLTETGKKIAVANKDNRYKLLIEQLAGHESFRYVLLKLLKRLDVSKSELAAEILKETADLPETRKIGVTTVNRRQSGVKSFVKQVLESAGY